MCGYADSKPCPPCIYLRFPSLTMDSTCQRGGIEALKEIKSLMTDPLLDMWACSNCNYENEHFIHCIMCDIPRPGAILLLKLFTLGDCSALVVNKNQTAAVAARVHGPGHLSKGTSQSVKQPPCPAHESPHHDAKEKAIASMKHETQATSFCHACVQFLCNRLFLPRIAN